MIEDAPFVSVIVPTRGRLAQLRVCIASLVRLAYPAESCEIIIINDGGDPFTVAEIAAGARHRILVVDQPWGGPANARSRGLALARGSIVAFTDDDCEVAPDWLGMLVETVQRQPDALAGGRTVNALANNLCASASQLLIDYLYEYYHGSGRPASLAFFASNNICARTDHLRHIGGFDGAFGLPAGEDRDLCDRWRSAGFVMEYVPGALVHHRHGMDLGAFTRQHFNYGRGAFTFHSARSARTGAGIRVEPLGFYTDLLLYPATRASRWQAPALTILIGWAQVVNALGYFAERFAPRAAPGR